MALPERSSTWPPPEWAEHHRIITESRLWLIGDLQKLAAWYATKANRDQAARWRRFLDGILRRRTSGPATKSADRLHVPLPRQIAGVSASELFSEPPTLQMPDAHVDDDPTDDPVQAAAAAAEERLAWIMEEDGWPAKLLLAAHLASGEGGVYLRPVWDRDVADHPMLTIVHYDRAVPKFRFGRLAEVTFWEDLEVDVSGNVWRHLEHHTPGRIEHALYVGRSDELGGRRELAAHKDTARYAGDDGNGIIDLTRYGIEDVLPEHVPNILPNAITLDPNVGSSDTAGMEDQLEAIDEADSSWARDVRVAKSMVIVPDEYLERAGRGSGAEFDFDREVFAPLDIDVGQEGATDIQVVQFNIRADEFDATVRSRSDRLVIAAGYSPQSFGWAADGSVQTATEVDARTDLTAETTAKKRRYWTRALAPLAEKILKLDAGIFGSGVTPMRPEVLWPTVSEVDTRDTAATLNLLKLAGAISTEEKVRMLHPDWDNKRVAEEVERILRETNLEMGDPTGGFV